MKTLDNGPDKIQKIGEKLRFDVIEPAKAEAQQIIEAAHRKASEIVAQAEKQAKEVKAFAHSQIEQEKNIFQSSMLQASKQSLGALRQAIEDRLFNDQLTAVLKGQMADPQIIADLINAIVKAIEKEGLGADLSAVIPQAIPAQDVSKLLLQEVLKKLKGQTLTLGAFAGGAQIKIEDKQIRVDLSDQAIKELLSSYVRKDFRQLIFAKED